MCDNLDEKRLINIILLLYSNNLELVIEIPNQDENWHDPHHNTLKAGGRMDVLSLTDDEASWLIEDNIVELDSGNDDPLLFFRQYVYRMTDDARKRLITVAKNIIENRRKIV